MKHFLDNSESGAWPFLVGGVICLVDSVNERGLHHPIDSIPDLVGRLPALLRQGGRPDGIDLLLSGVEHLSMTKCPYPEADSRSVMPSDALGCTRTTLMCATRAFSGLVPTHSTGSGYGGPFRRAFPGGVGGAG